MLKQLPGCSIEEGFAPVCNLADTRVRFNRVCAGYAPVMVDKFMLEIGRQSKEMRHDAENLKNQLQRMRDNMRQECNEDIVKMSAQLEEAWTQNADLLLQLKQAQVREKASIIQRNRDNETISQLKEAIESHKLERLQVELGSVTRERDECTAQLSVARAENQELSCRLSRIMEEKQLLSDELDAAKEKLEVYRQKMIHLSDLRKKWESDSQLYG